MSDRIVGLRPGATVVVRSRYTGLERTTTVAGVLTTGGVPSGLVDVNGATCTTASHTISQGGGPSLEETAAQLIGALLPHQRNRSRAA